LVLTGSLSYLKDAKGEAGEQLEGSRPELQLGIVAELVKEKKKKKWLDFGHI
jgi:hypothetical protein